MSETAGQERVDDATRAAFMQLLQVAGIGRVAIIDDVYARTEDDHSDVEMEDVIADARMEPARYQEVIPALADLETDKADKISVLIRNAWEDQATQSALRAIYPSEQTPGDRNTDVQANYMMKELAHGIDGVSYTTFSGITWVESAGSFLDDDTAGGALILVDRDFSQEDKSRDHGLQLIADILRQSSGRVFCALVSHTVTPEDEREQWRQLAEQHDIDADRFVVIAKQRIATEPPDLPGFLRLIRLAILCGRLKELRNVARKHLEDAIKATHEELEQWNVFDFDEAIFGSSRREGVWEGETLLRVMLTFAGLEARKRIVAETDVHAAITAARDASHVEIPGPPVYAWPRTGTLALKYQQAELYVDGDFLNQNHLPLETGEVFTRNGKQFILLAQPCDLMVRGDGKRANDGKLVRMVPLCEIRHGDPKQKHHYALPFWGEDGSSSHVDFNKLHLVRLAVLDLCVFREDGQVRFVPQETSSPRLHESWRRHRERLYKQLSNEVRQALKVVATAATDKSLKKMLEEQLLCCSNTRQFKMVLDPKTQGFSVNLQRTRRVHASRAADILREFARHQSRTAFEQALFTPDVDDGDVSDAGE